MASRYDGPDFVPYEDELEEDWDSGEGDAAPGEEDRTPSSRGRRLGRSAAPRLVLGLALLVLLAAVIWWGVQAILLPPVAAPTPTPMVTLAILPPPTSAPTSAATAAVATTPPSPAPLLQAGSMSEGQRVQIVGTGAEGIRFRSGPGTDYLTLSILLDGAELLVLDGPEEGDGFTWWRLEMEDGTIGWAAEDWLRALQSFE